MKTKPFPTVRWLAGLTLLLVALTGCAGAGGGGGGSARSSGTPVNPWANTGGADTATAASTGAQPRRY